MPRIELTSFGRYTYIPVEEPGGTPLNLPRIQFRCWLRLPGVLFPRDAIIDTGSPFTWLPEEAWENLTVGVDYEELPFPQGYPPPRGQTAGWSFTFRFARVLRPIGIHDGRAELSRQNVIVQLADGNPPIPPGSQKPAVVVLGLWGGILENTNLLISTDPASGHVVGALEW